MFNAQKSPNSPESLQNRNRHDAEDVINQLKKDFHEKCYICGSKSCANFEVEHFIPHRNQNDDLKFDWNNLFWSCGYCNGIKSTTYNNNGRDIINPVIANIEELLNHQALNFPAIDISFSKNGNDYKIDNTIELLTKIFIENNGGSPAQILKREQLIKSLRSEIAYFANAISDLFRADENNSENLKNDLIPKIKDHFIPNSNFLEFKRHFINSQPSVKSKLLGIIGLEEI